ncbi:MAG: hypothetical protein WC789_04395 [Lentisphaeria bacterium]|jgi:hypothetical protein
MRTGKALMVAAVVVFLGGVALAGRVHQSLPGDKLYTGDGGNAVAKGQMETSKVEGAESGQVARIKGNLPQWGYVTCWFGIPAPQGSSLVRLRIYVDGQKPAKCFLYTSGKDGQNLVGELKVPADAKAGIFVAVDVPVTAKEEWSGLIIKKAEKSDLPGPWIDTVSVVLPD